MAAARREFARKGYAGTSLRNITAQAGVTTGAFYNNFRDKKEIYLDILEELSRKLSRIIEAAIQDFLEAYRAQSKKNPAEELLRPAIHRVFKESMLDRDLFEILRRDGLGIDSGFGAYYSKIVQECIEPMRKGLEDFIEAGYARPYKTENLAQIVVILFFSVVIFATHDPRSDLDGWVDTIAAMVHGGAKQLSLQMPLTLKKSSG